MASRRSSAQAGELGRVVFERIDETNVSRQAAELA
jgi:hypothetical protein